MVEQSVWWFRRRWRRAAVDGVHQFAVPLPQQGVVCLHLLGEPVRLHAVACGGHELLGERAQHGRDDADDGCQQVLVHIILSLGYGSQGYESGTVTLQTTQLGAASVRFAKHKTKPKAVLVTRVRNNQDGDDRTRIFNPIVWDITATEFQVRFWRLDTHNWAESWPLTFSYLAIW